MIFTAENQKNPSSPPNRWQRHSHCSPWSWITHRQHTDWWERLGDISSRKQRTLKQNTNIASCCLQQDKKICGIHCFSQDTFNNWAKVQSSIPLPVATKTEPKSTNTGHVSNFSNNWPEHLELCLFNYLLVLWNAVCEGDWKHRQEAILAIQIHPKRKMHTNQW